MIAEKSTLGPDRRMIRSAPRLLAFLAVPLLAACGGSSSRPASSLPPPPPPPPAGTLDFAVDSAYVTQGAQDHAGTVPLVQGRAGLLRIFVKANEPNSAAPVVRVTLLDTASGEALGSWNIAAPGGSVPTAIVESDIGSSWNLSMAGTQVQPGRHLTVEIDPAGSVAGEYRANDLVRVPATGSLEVRSVGMLSVSAVPIVQSGLTPNVETPPRTAASWLETAQRIHPLASAAVSVHVPYTTSRVLQADDSNGDWEKLLADLRTVRVAEGSSSTYLGAVATSYTSGVAGIGYVGYPAALAWDKSSSYQSIAAHELGHTFNRQHAPCAPAGTVMTGIDPLWPSDAAYAGALIGTVGWDSSKTLANSLVDPETTKDIMGYCSPKWASDYTYRGVLDFLTPGQPAAPPALRQPSLVVSAFVRAGRVEIEPAFSVDTTPSLPPSGERVLELLDGSGAVLAAIPFEPGEVAREDDRPAARHAVFAVPLPAGWDVRALRVVERGVELARREAVRATGAAAPAFARVGRTAYVRWDARAHPLAVARDVSTGEVVALLRGGEAAFAAGRDVEVLFSDGVTTRARAVVATPR